MLYREAGQFKTRYEADMAVFPIRQDVIGIALIIAAAYILPPFLGHFVIGTVLIPFLQPMVRSVDVEGKRVVIDPPEGLLDI